MLGQLGRGPGVAQQGGLEPDAGQAGRGDVAGLADDGVAQRPACQETAAVPAVTRGLAAATAWR
jgi:hypothetical protein